MKHGKNPTRRTEAEHCFRSAESGKLARLQGHPGRAGAGTQDKR